MNANILVGALVVFLLVLILLMLGLHVYAGWKWERQRREAELYSHEAHEQKAADRKGLNRAMVDALPTFIYNTDTIQSLKASKGRLDQAGMECPVCLCEFQHNEKCRLLPKCCHRFHADCIDTWLLSNASCPVCRANAGPEMEVSSVRDELRGSDDSNIIGASAQFPTNILFWGNNSHVTSRVSSDHPPSLVIQIDTQADLIPPPSSSSSTDQPHASPSTPIHRLRSLRRLLSREISKQVQHLPTQEQAIQIDDYSGDGGRSPSISELKINNHSGAYGGRSPSISGPKL